MHAASDIHRKDDEHRPQHTRDMHPPDRRRRERTSSGYATLHYLGRKAGRRRMHQITIMSKHLRAGEAYKKPLARASKKAVATTTRRTERSTVGNKITKNRTLKSYGNETTQHRKNDKSKKSQGIRYKGEAQKEIKMAVTGHSAAYAGPAAIFGLASGALPFP